MLWPAARATAVRYLFRRFFLSPYAGPHFLTIMPTPSREPILPPEVQDIILDHLHDDKKTLSTCSLVCQLWRACSQYHIFRSLDLAMSRHNASAKARLLEGRLKANPAKCSMVQELHITGGLSSTTCVKYNTILSIVKRLPKLRVLTIREIVLAPSGTIPHSAPQLFDLLSRLPDLRTVEIHTVTCHLLPSEGEAISETSPEATTLMVKSLFPRLENLHLEDLYFPPIWLSQFLDNVANAHKRTIGGLRQVSLQPVVYSNYGQGGQSLGLAGLQACGRLLEAAGPTLEYLSLDLNRMTFGKSIPDRNIQGKYHFNAYTFVAQDLFYFVLATQKVCEVLRLSSCHKLKSLLLHLPSYLGSEQHDDPWLAASACLRLIPPSAPLETLTVVVYDMYVIASFLNTDMDRQKHILSTFDDAACSLPQLQRVLFTVSHWHLRTTAVDPWSYSPDFVSKINSHLPRLNEKVQVDVNNPYDR